MRTLVLQSLSEEGVNLAERVEYQSRSLGSLI